MVTKTRSQEEDPKGKGLDVDESEPRWFTKLQEATDLKLARFQEANDQKLFSQLSKFQEANDQKFSQLHAMIAELSTTRNQTNQPGEDQSTLDRSSTQWRKPRGSGSDHFERSGDDRRFGVGQFGEGADDDEEQYLVRDEELAETEVATELNGIEDRVVENEANSDVISASVKKEQIPQIQVPISKLERGLQIHNVSPTVCEDSQYVVGCDELFGHQEAMLQVSHVKVRDELLTKSTDVTNNQAAHYLFDKMPGRSSRANRVWKPGGLLYVRDHSGGSILMITQQFHGLQLQRIIYMDMQFQEVLIDDVLSVMVCWRMDETSSDLLLLNGKENEGCLNGSQALVLMKGITESSSRIEELLKEEPDFVKVNEVKMEKQKLRNVGDGVKQDKNRFSGDLGAKIFMALEELHLLQDEFEMVKELLLKTSLVIQSLVSQEPAISATQEPAIFQPTLRFLMNTKQSCLSLRANRVWDPGGSTQKTIV